MVVRDLGEALRVGVTVKRSTSGQAAPGRHREAKRSASWKSPPGAGALEGASWAKSENRPRRRLLQSVCLRGLIVIPCAARPGSGFSPVTLSHPLLLQWGGGSASCSVPIPCLLEKFRDARGAASRPPPGAPLRPPRRAPRPLSSSRPTPPPLTSRPESPPHPVLHHQPLPFWLPAAPQPPFGCPALSCLLCVPSSENPSSRAAEPGSLQRAPRRDWWEWGGGHNWGDSLHWGWAGWASSGAAPRDRPFPFRRRSLPNPTPKPVRGGMAPAPARLGASSLRNVVVGAATNSNQNSGRSGEGGAGRGGDGAGGEAGAGVRRA